MATSIYYFTAPCKWAKLYTPDTKYNHYSIDMYLDEKGFELLNKTGCMLKVREDREGKKFVTFRRTHSKVTKDKLRVDGPPDILNADNAPMTGKALIGNDSVVTCKVSIYDAPKGKGHRLETVRVEKLNAYVPPEVHDDGIEAPF